MLPYRTKADTMRKTELLTYIHNYIEMEDTICETLVHYIENILRQSSVEDSLKNTIKTRFEGLLPDSLEHKGRITQFMNRMQASHNNEF